MSRMSSVHIICQELTEDWEPWQFACVVDHGLSPTLAEQLALKATADNLPVDAVTELFTEYCRDAVSCIG